MAFTKALYYPWIDIHEETWLKNAILYWDSIHTIVPRSMDTPYRNDFSICCADEGILKPLHVESRMDDIEDLADDVLKYLSSSEATELLLSAGDSSRVNIHPGKLPHTLQRLVHLHPEKLSHEIRYMIRHVGLVQSEEGDDDWLPVDARFADFYMTLLATKLSESCGIGLLTSMPASSRLASVVRTDGSLNNLIPQSGDCYDYPMRHRRSMKPSSLAQGVLSHFAFEGISINPEVPIKKLIKFRNKRADELRRFRIEMEALTGSVDFEKPVDAIRQQVSDIYDNKVIPAVADLKDSLTDARISWQTKDLLKIAFFSVPPTSGPLALMGLSAPYALLAGAGISLVASGILYNRDKKKILRDNPYSYLMAAERELT